MNATLHRVPFGRFAAFLGYLGIGIGLAFLVRFIFQVASESDLRNSYALDLISVGLPILVGCAVANLYPDIEVCEGGLRVQVFGFHWIFIPWADLIAMKELKTPYQSGPSRGTVVQAHGLTFFHLLIVSSLIKETTRGFVISSSIRGYDDLVEIIRQKLEEKAV